MVKFDNQWTMKIAIETQTKGKSSSDMDISISNLVMIYIDLVDKDFSTFCETLDLCKIDGVLKEALKDRFLLYTRYDN